MDDWISKKDLLKETGISYGQLYRWKREGLIPDSWFVKRSSYTGQETYLPRRQAVERVQFILRHKSGHTFGQMLSLLHPQADSRQYAPETLMAIPNTLQPMMLLADLTDSQRIDHAQALMVLLAARAAKVYGGMAESEMAAFMKALLAWQQEYDLSQITDGLILLLKNKGGVIPLFLCPEAAVRPGGDAREVFRMRVSDMQAEFTPLLRQLPEND